MAMEIHKPKAAHSVREFLIEIGTIVIGILIALGLETLLEAAHEHELVEHARADLRQELTRNRRALTGTTAQQRSAIAALDVYVSHAKDRLTGRAANFASGPTLAIDFRPMNAAGWEATVATQALAHMPYGEAQDLARAYSGGRIYNDYQADAIRHWYELSALPDDLSSLAAPDLKAALYQFEINRAYEASLLTAGDGLIQVYDKALADLH
jgi:hypothetical protein